MHAYILGEHGDTSFPLLSSASVGGQPLTSFAQYSPEKVQHAFDLAKNAAYKIIAAKGATYYAIGAVIMTIMKAIYSDAQVVLPLSVPINRYLGESNMSLSVPTILGRSGVQRILTITPNQLEQSQFAASAQALRQAYQSLT